MANRNPVPELTDEQRRQALEKSAYIRQLRAYHKGLLKDGHITFDEFLNVPCVRGMRVRDALRAVPGIGRKRAAAIMEDVGISPSRHVRGLGHRQRAGLLDAVEAFRGR